MNLRALQSQEVRPGLFPDLDARIGIINTLILIVGILLTPPRAWLAYPLLWTLIGILATLHGINIWRLARLAGLALPFTLTAATLLVTTPGMPVTTFLGMTITDAGVARFLEIVLKSWLSVQAALLLTLTTPFTEILRGLERLRVPPTLITIMSFMYRYLFTLRDEAERLLRARTARSGSPTNVKSGGSLIWRAKIAGGMVGNLFLRSYERSERVHAAMLARGYDGQPRRQAQDVPPLTWQAIGFTIVPLCCVILIQLIVRR
jgi:cobalt/nickel transport system permease protein